MISTRSTACRAQSAIFSLVQGDPGFKPLGIENVGSSISIATGSHIGLETAGLVAASLPGDIASLGCYL